MKAKVTESYYVRPEHLAEYIKISIKTFKIWRVTKGNFGVKNQPFKSPPHHFNFFFVTAAKRWMMLSYIELWSVFRICKLSAGSVLLWFISFVQKSINIFCPEIWVTHPQKKYSEGWMAVRALQSSKTILLVRVTCVKWCTKKVPDDSLCKKRCPEGQ